MQNVLCFYFSGCRVVYSSFAIVVLASTLFGCGGGSGSPQATPTPTGTFSLSVTPSSTVIAPGVTRTVQINVNSQGFFGPVNITASGLPTGVSVSPASLVVNASHSAGLNISASAAASPGNVQLTFQGSSSGVQASTSFALQINPVATPASRPFTEIGGSLERGFYDEIRGLLFATNPSLNEVDVISGVDLSVQARIPVPAPLGIDQMTDGSTLVVGTLTQALYTIDENTFAITQHAAPNFTFLRSTTTMTVPVALANGKVLIIGTEIGIASSYIFGGQHLLEWDSISNTFSELTLSALFPGFTAEVDNLKRSADHKWAIFGADKLYLYSSDTDTFTSTTAPPDLRDVAANPDGTQFAVTMGTQVNFYDRNFAQTGSVAAQQGVFALTGLRYSTDGLKLYWPLQGTGGTGNITDVVDSTAFKELGHVGTTVGASQERAEFFTIDSGQTGFYGVAGGGVATISLTHVSTGPTQSDVGSGFFPLLAPLNVTLPVSFSTNNLPPGTSILVGGAPIEFQSFDPVIRALVPQSSVPGPVNVLFTLPDGQAFLEPLDFSYGVTPEAITATLLPATGNPRVGVFGFGFSDPQSQLPSITIGGQPVTSILENTGLAPSILQELFITVPNGALGLADLGITGTKGSATQTAAVDYVPMSIIAHPGILQLLYDTHRNRIYGLTTTQVDIFNPTTLQFEAPLVPNNVIGENYLAMALTPDGTKLLLADAANSTLTVFNPDSPATSTTVTGLPGPPSCIVATDTGKAFMGSGLGSIEVDLATLTTTFRQNDPFGGPIKFSATLDGSHMVATSLFNTSGGVAAWNSTTDTFVSQGFIDGFWTDAVIANDGSQFGAVSGDPILPGTFVGFFDEQVHFLNATIYPDLAPPDAIQASGGVFSPGGSVLLQPVVNGIEFFDAKTGKLRARLMTPEPLSKLTFPQPSTGVALDPTGQTIYAISTSGLVIITLPTPVDQLAAVNWPLLSVRQAGQTGASGLLMKRRKLTRVTR